MVNEIDTYIEVLGKIPAETTDIYFHIVLVKISTS